jgi:hypothetical protein
VRDNPARQAGAFLLNGRPVNLLEREKHDGMAGRIAQALLRMDLVIHDEQGYLPFSQVGGALLFHRLSKLYRSIASCLLINCVISAGRVEATRSVLVFGPHSAE